MWRRWGPDRFKNRVVAQFNIALGGCSNLMISYCQLCWRVSGTLAGGWDSRELLRRHGVEQVENLTSYHPFLREQQGNKCWYYLELLIFLTIKRPATEHYTYHKKSTLMRRVAQKIFSKKLHGIVTVVCSECRIRESSLTFSGESLKSVALTRSTMGLYSSQKRSKFQTDESKSNDTISTDNIMSLAGPLTTFLVVCFLANKVPAWGKFVHSLGWGNFGHPNTLWTALGTTHQPLRTIELFQTVTSAS